MQSAPSLCQDTNQSVSQRKAAARFLLIFLAIVAGFYSLTLSPWVDAHALYPVMKASASGTSALLNLFGVRTVVTGVVVHGPAYSVAVRRGCDPLEPIILFVAGVIAFPAPWSRKVPGLLAGSGILFGLNLARVATLYLLGAGKSPRFESIHLWWWPAGFIICTLALWVLWLLWAQPASPAAQSDPPLPPAGLPNTKPPVPRREGNPP